jgi:hypothetical protein
MRNGSAAAVVAALLLVGVGVAQADTGSYSGSFTPTACGPLHPFTVASGETTIDLTAAATLTSNDIVLRLEHPAGTVLATGDTLTSPESLHYARQDLEPGSYYAHVCPFDDSSLDPRTYTGTYATSNAPVAGIPGSDPTAAGGTPTPTRVAGKLAFAPATVIDPQRTEGEPLNFVDRDDAYWESGPWGTTTQQSFIHRSTNGGLEFHVDSPAGLRPDGEPGGGDTDITLDDQGIAYFVDLEALVNLGTAVSNDNGKTWRKNPLAVQNAAVDRQWYAIDNGTTSSAVDNTLFLAFHELAVGTFIYSSPGSTGPNDPVGGLVWQSSSANAPLPLASDAACAQLRFDPVNRNLYYGCNDGDHVRVSVGHVAPGQRTGITYRNYAGPKSPGGGDPGHFLPALATDSAGNVYIAWIDKTDNNLYYSYSTDQARTWSTPVRVSSPPSNTTEFVWADGGSPGTLALTWYGTDAVGQPDSFPKWRDDPVGSTSVKWYGYVALISNAASLTPTIAQQPFTEKPMHYGEICNRGTLCVAPEDGETSGGDRTMADFFAVSLDQSDAMRLVFNDTTNQHHGAALYEVRQLGPKTLHGKKLSRATPSNPMADETNDAQWPHYGPTAPGPNVPQLDLTKLELGQPSAGTLRVRMTAANLAALLPPTGKTSSVWLTRFEALSVGNHGEEAYRIFYVGAESVGGLAPSLFAGSTTCTETDPGNCKVLEYPPTAPATGKVCGNTIVVDVPLQGGFGGSWPITGTKLYSVTAFSFGRSDPLTDVYADVDATHAFDYRLGSASGGASC